LYLKRYISIDIASVITATDLIVYQKLVIYATVLCQLNVNLVLVSVQKKTGYQALSD
jgi:hypothetical protein